MKGGGLEGGVRFAIALVMPNVRVWEREMVMFSVPDGTTKCNSAKENGRKSKTLRRRFCEIVG